MSADSPSGPYESLSHWRGFAATWVAVFHCFSSWLLDGPGALPAPLLAFLRNGWLGVHVFFVISGYCIAARLASDHRAGRSVIRFWLDRLWRIYPAYWMAVVASALLALLALPWNGGPLFSSSAHIGALPGTIAEGLITLLSLEPWFSRPSYVLVAWSLAYEVAFYGLAGGLFSLAKFTGRPRHAYLLGGLIAGIGLFPSIWSVLPFVTLWTHFYLGALAWLLVHRNHAGFSHTVAVFGPVALGAMLLPIPHAAGLRCAVAVAWLLVVLHRFDDRIAKHPAGLWLGWVGTFSYSLYLVHVPVVSRSRNLLERFWPPGRLEAIWVPIMALILAFAASRIFFLIIERSFERARSAYRRRVQATVIPA